MSSSPIHRLPLEIVEKILLDLHDDPTRPPFAIVPFLATSKRFHAALAFHSNSHLYARIFRRCFDVSAPARRLGDVNAPGLAKQLRANCLALRCIRRADVHADDIVPTFWTCFSMLMENDGKNRCQLDAAGLPRFVDTFVRERLYENAVDGWPAENEVNSLALWLVWLTTTQERLTAETPAQRAQMTRLILPFVLMPVRYAAYLAPHVHWSVPLSPAVSLPHSVVTAHGPYPHYRNGFSRSMPLYHVDTIRLVIPLASVPAKLLYFAHREVFPVGVPPHLPRDRAHAIQLGVTHVGPTQEDVHELNEYKVAKFVPSTTWDWWSEIPDYHQLGRETRSKLAPSARWDDDWSRLADCNNLFAQVSLKRMHYTPGLLCGLWQGRMLYPDEVMYRNIIQTRQMPPGFSDQTVGIAATPVFMRLREFHCMDVRSNESAASGGIQKAWFHDSTRFRVDTHDLTITCQERTTTYDEYVAGGPGLHDESKCRGCEYRGTPDMVFRERDARYLMMADQILAEEGMGDGEDDDDDVMDDTDDVSDGDVDMANDASELVISRKCNGILDIVLVGETDVRHGQAWHHYDFYGRVREWDGLVALIRVPARAPIPGLGFWIFTGYVVGEQNFVGNWRTRELPGEPVSIEGAFAMSKRE